MATDQRKSWTGLGLAAGTVVTSGNINTVGNGDNVTWQTPTGSPVITTRQYGGSQGNGIEFVSNTTTEVMRVDLNAATSNTDSSQDAPLEYFHMKYKVTAQPATADYAVLLGRSAAAASGNLYHNVTSATINGLNFRNSANANLTSALTGSPTFSAANGRAPAMVIGDIYEVDMAIHQGTSSTTGRIQGRVKSVSNPGTWNGGVEYYFDSGYTANTATDLMRYWRLFKPVAGNTINTAQMSEIFWGTKNTPSTSLDKTVSAPANFWAAAAPTLDDGDTAATYFIEAVGTAAVGGALTYTMLPQVSGTPRVPLNKGTGRWIVNQDTAGPLVYDVQVSEAGGGATVLRYTVPTASTVAPGQFRRRVWNGSAWI